MNYEQLREALQLLFLACFISGFIGAAVYQALDAFLDRGIEFFEHRRRMRASREWHEMREAMKQPGANAASAVAGACDRQGEGRKAGR